MATLPTWRAKKQELKREVHPRLSEPPEATVGA
jgi:hypothetical protein